MAKTSGMVQAKIVKGAKAGTKVKMTCAQIFACFDPEIKFGSHSDMQGSLDKVESYDPKKGKGYQAEHVPPAGTMHQSGRGLKGEALVTGAQGSSYSTGGATTWMAHDGQTSGREHKILTDTMREFSQLNDAQRPKVEATLKEWLSKYKEGVKDALKTAVPKRKIKKPPDLNEDSLIDQAAECIEEAAKKYFEDAGVDENTKLRNPWPARKDQIAAAKAVAQAAKKTRVLG
jgi:hypothetical protein